MLDVSPAALLRYEALGLVRAAREGGVEGYEPAELRRVWTVLSLHRDAGINLAGIEAILRLRDQLDDAHRRMRHLALEVLAAIDREPDPAQEEILEAEVGDAPGP